MIKRFQLEQNGSSVATETVAGITTFASMVYIIFVNPAILSTTGMDQNAVFVATILSSVFATLLMGLWANYPIALAPAMGINSFFAFSVVATMGYSWQMAMAAVFVSGIIFTIISLTGLRNTIINAIPLSLKNAVAAGIGFFITFIGLKNAGIITAHPATFVTIGNLAETPVLVSIIGFILTAVFVIMKLPAAIFLGMLASIILGLTLGVCTLPSNIIAPIPSLEPILFGLFTELNSKALLSNDFWIVVFAFFFIDFFDTNGVLIAVGQRIGLIKKDGSLKKGQQALLADSVGTIFGAILGTSSVTTYVESMTGIEQGGRTGLSSVVTALCFLSTLFFSPLLSIVNANITAPTLMIVGCLMVDSLGRIVWNDFALTVSSFLTVIFMVLTFSIAKGIAVGFFMYPILMLASKRGKKVHPIMYGLMILFLLHFMLQ